MIIYWYTTDVKSISGWLQFRYTSEEVPIPVTPVSVYQYFNPAQPVTWIIPQQVAWQGQFPWRSAASGAAPTPILMALDRAVFRGVFRGSFGRVN